MAVARTKSSPSPEHVLIPCSVGDDATEQIAAADRLLLHFSQLARSRDPLRKKLDSFSVMSFAEDPVEQELIRSLVRAHDGVGCHFLEMRRLLFPGGGEALDGLLERCNGETARGELRRIMRTLAILLAARQLGCAKVYLGDTCDRLAVEVIHSTCMGRGETIPWMLAPCQPYELGLAGRIEICRPLRDLVDREVEQYLRLVGKEDGRPPTSPQSPGTRPRSVHALSESFLRTMDADNSATVSTVVRTAAKLRTAAAEDPTGPCSICLAPVKMADGQEELCTGCRSLLAVDLAGVDQARELLLSLKRQLT